MINVCNESCLQKSKKQTRCFDKNRPFPHFTIRGKREDGRTFILFGKGLEEVRRYLAKEEQEINRKFIL